jgi:hypothetical protein
MTEATAGDYDHLLATTMQWVTVKSPASDGTDAFSGTKAHAGRSWFRCSKPIEDRSQLSDPDNFVCQHVGPQTAMRGAASRCAILAMAEGLAQLPMITYRCKDDGLKKPARERPAYGLVQRNVNPWTSAAKLGEQLTVDAPLHGHGLR